MGDLLPSPVGERPAGRTLAGVGVGFAGVATLVTAHGLDGSFPAWTLVVIVLAGLSWAAGSRSQPRLRLPRDPFVVVVYEMLVGGGTLTILGLVSGETFDPSTYSARSWAAWVYLVLFGSVLAFSAYVWLLQSAAVSLVATYAYVNPLVAVTLGWLILSEPVTAPTLVGGAIVVGSVAVVIRSELAPNKRPTTPPRARHDDNDRHRMASLRHRGNQARPHRRRRAAPRDPGLLHPRR